MNNADRMHHRFPRPARLARSRFPVRATTLARGLAFGVGIFASSVAFADTAPAAPAAPPAPRSVKRNCVAETPATKQEAITRYERGVQLFEEQDYRLALVEFERAYELTCTASVLYNIGIIHFTLNNYAAALRSFEDYREHQQEMDPERRAQVDGHIKSLRSRVALVTITVNVPGASVLVDDTSLGQTPLAADQLVDAGRHRITVTKSGYQTYAEPIVLAVGDKQAVNVTLAPVAVARKEAPSYVWVGWMTTGVLAAAAGVTGALSIVSTNRAERLEGQVFNASSTELADEARTAKNFALATDILLGTAIIAGGVSLYFSLKGPSKTEVAKTKTTAPKPNEGLAVSPFGASYRVTF